MVDSDSVCVREKSRTFSLSVRGYAIAHDACFCLGGGEFVKRTSFASERVYKCWLPSGVKQRKSVFNCLGLQGGIMIACHKHVKT